jgi:hypothetical protein
LTDQNPSGVPNSLRCRKCQVPLELHSEEDIIDKFGVFARVGCTAPACGHIDWYKDVAFVALPSDPLPDDGPGEIWIHDVILGLSFKADVNQQAAWDGMEKQV